MGELTGGGSCARRGTGWRLGLLLALLCGGIPPAESEQTAADAALRPWTATLADSVRVAATIPTPNAWSAAPTDEIHVWLTCPAGELDPSTVNSATFQVFGRKAGYGSGTFTVSGCEFAYRSGYLHRLDGSFLTGDWVTAVVTPGIADIGRNPAKPYQWTFRVRPRGGRTGDMQEQAGFRIPDWCGGGAPVEISTADLNGDTCEDLLLALKGDGTRDRLCILGGRYNGWWEFQDYGWRSAALPGDPSDFCSSDFDADGRPDFAVTGFQWNSVLVGFNDTPFDTVSGMPGAFSFDVRSFPVERGHTCVQAADVDNDGWADLVLGNVYHEMTVLRGAGTGRSFSPAGLARMSLREETVTALDVPDFAVADLDGDGRVDGLIGNVKTDRIERWTLAAGGGQFAESLIDSLKARSLALGNFRGDFLPDLVALTEEQTGQARVHLFENLSSPGRFSFVLVDSCTLPGDPTGMTLGDLEDSGDGMAELMISYGGEETVEIRSGASPCWVLRTLTGGRPGALVSVDQGPDGDEDLLVVDLETRDVRVFENQALAPADNWERFGGCALEFGSVFDPLPRCPAPCLVDSCRIVNTLDHVVQIGSFAITGSSAFELLGPFTGQSLAPGESLTVVVRFCPPNTPETCDPEEEFRGSIYAINCSCGCSSAGDLAVVELTAHTALARLNILVDGQPFDPSEPGAPPTLDLGLVDQCVVAAQPCQDVRVVALENTGAASLRIESIEGPGEPFRLCSSYPTPLDLSPGQGIFPQVGLADPPGGGDFQDRLRITLSALYDCAEDCRAIGSVEIPLRVSVKTSKPQFDSPMVVWEIREHETPAPYSLHCRYDDAPGRSFAAQLIGEWGWCHPHLETWRLSNCQLGWSGYSCEESGVPNGPCQVSVLLYDEMYGPGTCVADTCQIQITLTCLDDPPCLTQLSYSPDCDNPEDCNNCDCSPPHPDPEWDCGEQPKWVDQLCIGEDHTLEIELYAHDPERTAALGCSLWVDGEAQAIRALSGPAWDRGWAASWKPPMGYTGGSECRTVPWRARVFESATPALADSVGGYIRVSRADPNLTSAVTISTPGGANIGSDIEVEACVFNIGRTVAANFDLQLEPVSSPRDDCDVTRWSIATLAPNQQRCFSATCRLERGGSYCFRAMADPDNRVAESNESDNRSTTECTESREGPVCVCPLPITPNDDGHNDYLRFDYSLRYPRTDPRVEIYDVRGHLIYDSRERPLSRWHDVGEECQLCPRICGIPQQCELLFDGRDSGGRLLPGGVYLYVFYLNGQAISHGEVVIVR